MSTHTLVLYFLVPRPVIESALSFHSLDGHFLIFQLLTAVWVLPLPLHGWNLPSRHFLFLVCSSLIIFLLRLFHSLLQYLHICVPQDFNLRLLFILSLVSLLFYSLKYHMRSNILPPSNPYPCT